MCFNTSPNRVRCLLVSTLESYTDGRPRSESPLSLREELTRPRPDVSSLWTLYVALKEMPEVVGLDKNE